jgi:CO/xanthine dehydrogenase FAD-binding subunit
MKPKPNSASEGDVWSLDANVSLQAALDSPGCPQPVCQALTGALTWQERNRREVRRALASPRVAPQWSAALLALGATITLEGKDGSSEMLLETFLASRPQGEIRSLHVRTKGLRWGEAHVGRTPADEPIVAAVAAVEMDNGQVGQARVVLTGVWPEAARLAQAPAQLVGGPLDKERIQAVATAVEQEVTPEGDFRGSEEYRRAMAGVLTRRALEQCLGQEVEHV